MRLHCVAETIGYTLGHGHKAVQLKHIEGNAPNHMEVVGFTEELLRRGQFIN